MECQERAQIAMYAGDDNTLIVNVVDDQDAPVDVTAATGVTFGILNAKSHALVKGYTLGNGITVNGDEITIHIDDADSAMWMGLYAMALSIDLNGEHSTILQGDLLVEQTYLTGVAIP